MGPNYINLPGPVKLQWINLWPIHQFLLSPLTGGITSAHTRQNNIPIGLTLCCYVITHVLYVHAVFQSTDVEMTVRMLAASVISHNLSNTQWARRPDAEMVEQLFHWSPQM